MTAEDARRSVEDLCVLLRNEVEEAMARPASGGASSASSGSASSGSASSGSASSGSASSGGASSGGAAVGSGGANASPDWLVTGEQHLARALRASRPGDFRGDAGGFWRARSRFRSWALAALVVGGLGLGAGIAAWQNQLGRESPALAFRTNDDPPERSRRSGRIIAPADRGEEVRFSDGSRLSLSAGSMLRVRETDTHGAMVIVEEGQVESSIRHTGKARWSVFAGPYEVRVVGTRFSTTWDPARQRLSVVLHQGSVQVLGKGIDELVELKPGQRFDAGGAGGEWFVTAVAELESSADADADSAARAASSGSSGAAVDQAARVEANAERGATGSADRGRPATSTHADGDGVSWSALVASGRFEEVLDEAAVRGEASCLKSCSIADLRALADAARYTGRFSLAERALSQLRSTAAAEAPRAGFLLGSMNEAQGRPAAALEWYGRYLAEAPAGGLAAEARAGRMRALLALGQVDAAKAAARDYLRLHPAGVGAATARQILLRP